MMKVKFNTDDILPQLQNVASIVTTKPVTPILSCVLFNVVTDENGYKYAELTTSDGDLFVTMRAEIIESNAFDVTSFCVDAKMFNNTLKGLASHVVEIEYDEENDAINGTYNTGSFTLPSENPKEFPKPFACEDETSVVLPAHNLSAAISQTIYAVATDPLRPVMNAVHFDFFKDKMIAVASDSKVLAKHEDSAVNHDGEASLNLPTKAALSVVKSFGHSNEPVLVKFNEKNVTFSSGNNAKITARLVEGRFPNYNAVIPKNNDVVAVIDKQSFESALKRVSPLGNSASNLVKLTFDNNSLVVESEDLDFSTRAKERLTCEFSSYSIKIGFRSTFLLEILQSISSESICFAMKDSTKAALVSPNFVGEEKSETDYVALIMPMMITGN